MKPASDMADESTTLTDEEILALVETRSQRFQRQIRFRDWRELIAGGVAAVMIALRRRLHAAGILRRAIRQGRAI